MAAEKLKTTIGSVLAFFVAVLVGGFGLHVVSDSARPGEAMYAIDSGIEQVHTKATFSQDARLERKIAVASERLDELATQDPANVGTSLVEFDKALVDIQTELNIIEDVAIKNAAQPVIVNLSNLSNNYRQQVQASNI